ncbi:Vacuolar import and degradation protein-like protein [Emericellopsis cladophorae]|uniref:Vacuolar import and degradation protein-like protein n=1 Tax=Emericellopsis cladophorae TaxID=2686198 RepID=A0A9P9XUT8_9HYPO|nr:Vacuolar import and degradation protein-like protein [Emericellopsis cladophorae]KAI6778135.1 Vacuolar import and degradation protein-like protein [Emericellopsis cladophorae]
MNSLRALLFGSAQTALKTQETEEEIICQIPNGQFYLVRPPNSPKGASQQIFTDAAVYVRKEARSFEYTLVVQRAYDEEDPELEEETDEHAEETSFQLNGQLHLRTGVAAEGRALVAWKVPDGDEGDLYEFICGDKVTQTDAKTFLFEAQRCQYEAEYQVPRATATEEDLEEFAFDEDPPIPPASPLYGPDLSELTRSIDDSLDDMVSSNHNANIGVKRQQTPVQELDESDVFSPAEPPEAPEALELYAALPAELHVFDPAPGHFALVEDSVISTVTEVGKWQYWLQIKGKDRVWVSTTVQADMNPVFDFEMLSFVFNHFSPDGTARSWLLRFQNQNLLEKFQEGLMQAIWEQLNETKWQKIQDKEREYVLDAFNDLTMEDAPPVGEEQEEPEYDDEDEEEDQGLFRGEEYDPDEEFDNVDVQGKDADMNSQLAVGYKHDRSFVVRGNKIGVFRHNPDNKLEFSTNISKLEHPSTGKKMGNPSKVMLHSEDRDLVFQSDTNPNKLYRMDLEAGKVVDEWNVHDDIGVVSFGPENKFAQMTAEQTFLGVSNNALFRVDPRVHGDKLVQSDLKQYATKNDFSALATTQKGYIAVASNKGDIRLFDKLGMRAKTSLPALGDPIVGMDVSADGRWILGTTKNYILLVDAQQKDGKNEGKLGFEKGFSADQKPKPRRLALTAEHVAQFFHETGKPISFTPAKFNTGIDGTAETSIITATGPYIVEWSLKRVLRGTKGAYKIKRYEDEVKADDFKFGSDKNVIVALPNEVNMVAKQSFKKPTRESIMGNACLSGGRKSAGRIGGANSGRYKLGRDDVVDSPY